jgi:hypothetical protein
MIMNSYREYADLASAKLNDAAHRAAHRPDDQLQVSIANAQVFALLAVAESIRAASGQAD